MTDTIPIHECNHHNVAIVRRFLDEVVNGGRLDLIDELWTTDMVWQGGSMGEIHGIETYKQYMAANTTGAFTNLHLTIHEVIAAGDKVVVRFTNSGTQTGPFFGMSATGKSATWLGIGIYTIRDGKIADAWFAEDILNMLLQLGASVLPTQEVR